MQHVLAREIVDILRRGRAGSADPQPFDRLPMNELTVLMRLVRRALIGRARVEHRLDDGDVAGAAAEIAGEHLAHALGVAVGLLAQQRVRRGDHARRAEAALQRVMLAERGLQRRQIRRRGTAPRPSRSRRPRPAPRASGTSAPPRRRRSRCRRRTRRARSRHGSRSAADGGAGSPPASAAARPRPRLLAVDLELYGHVALTHATRAALLSARSTMVPTSARR